MKSAPLLALAALATVVRVAAVPTAAVSLSESPTAGIGWNNQSQTYGWLFSVTTSIEVTALGLFDYGQDGLADPHALGLWATPSAGSTGGTLLRSATISEGTAAPLEGFFRYVDIAPITLNVGEFYIVGAHYTGVPGYGYGALDTDPDRDAHRSYFYGPETLGPGITFLDGRSSGQQGGVLEFPRYGVPSSFTAHPVLGPNFLYNAAPAPTVPDTGPQFVGLAALAGLLVLHRRFAT